MNKINQLKIKSEKTLSFEKEVKSNPPQFNYEKLFEYIKSMLNEFQNIDILSETILQGKFDEVEKKFPLMFVHIKKGDLEPKVKKYKISNIKHINYSLTRVIIPLVIEKIFSLGKYDDKAGKSKAALSMNALYSSCYEKFDDPKFLFCIDISKTFILLEEYFNNSEFFLENKDLKQSLALLPDEVYLNMIRVLGESLDDLKETINSLEKENDIKFDIYPKVEFIEALADCLKLSEKNSAINSDKIVRFNDEQS